MKASRKVIAGVLAAVTVIGLLAAFFLWPGSEDGGVPVPPAAIPLTIDGLPDELTLGVVVSLTTDASQGAGWFSTAEGAQVATHRMELAGQSVRLVLANDKGSETGADQAVQVLAAENVAGVVAVTSGTHASRIAQAAAQFKIPVIYTNEADAIGEGSWTLASDTTAAMATLKQAVAARHLSKTAFVDAGGARPEMTFALETRYTGADQAREMVTAIDFALQEGSIDSLMISGNARLQAEVVALMQGARIKLPIFLSPEATNPLFSSVLSERGILDGDFTTVGQADVDMVALDSGPRGALASAYLSALRALSDDEKAVGLDGETAFAKLAQSADAQSHDAVVALACAAAKAGSNDPAKVSAALGTLSLGGEDGLVGPDLDLRNAHASASVALALQATSQDPGLRGVLTHRLYWFPVV